LRHCPGAPTYARPLSGWCNLSVLCPLAVSVAYGVVVGRWRRRWCPGCCPLLAAPCWRRCGAAPVTAPALLVNSLCVPRSTLRRRLHGRCACRRACSGVLDLGLVCAGPFWALRCPTVGAYACCARWVGACPGPDLPCPVLLFSGPWLRCPKYLACVCCAYWGLVIGSLGILFFCEACVYLLVGPAPYAVGFGCSATLGHAFSADHLAQKARGVAWHSAPIPSFLILHPARFVGTAARLLVRGPAQPNRRALARWGFVGFGWAGPTALCPKGPG